MLFEPHCNGYRILNCIDISDVDLPMQLDEFAGHYDGMSLRGNPGINVPEAAFNGVTFNKVGKIIKFLLLQKIHACDVRIIFKTILF